MFAYSLKVGFVCEFYVENTRVVVSTVGIFPIFPTSIVAEGVEMMAQAFEEFCKVFFLEAPVNRELRIFVGECYECIVSVQLTFVNHPDSPLS